MISYKLFQKNKHDFETERAIRYLAILVDLDVAPRKEERSRSAIKYSVVYYAVTFKKNNQVYLSFFLFFLNVDVCDADMNRAGCGPSMMCSLESCLSAGGVTIYWRV